MQVGENVSHYLLQRNVNPRRIRQDVAEDNQTKSQKQYQTAAINQRR